MMPSVIYETLVNDAGLNNLGIDSERVFESQSLDSRPVSDGYFITISFEELVISNYAIDRGPRTVTVAVHHSMDVDRDYRPLDQILNRIDQVLLAIENLSGEDKVRVSQIKRQSRSGNMIDEGWKTITRTSSYGVLYDEYAA